MHSLIAFWSHALAAALFAALTLWRIRDAARQPLQRFLAGAFAHHRLLGLAGRGRAGDPRRRLCRKRPQPSVDQPALQPLRSRRRARARAEARLWRGRRGHRAAARSAQRSSSISPSGALASDRAGASDHRPRPARSSWSTTSTARRRRRAGSHIRLAMLGLALIWFYDLNLYTIAYLDGPPRRR